MSRELHALISEKIYRQREKIIGNAISIPYLKAVGAENVWVVDVLYRSDEELLTAVPLAEVGRNVRDFVNVGTPVELQRSSTGQFYIVGLSDRKRGAINKKSYSIADSGLGFSEGWRLNGSGNYETGNGNEQDPGTPTETLHYYTSEMIPFGELDFGTTQWGAWRTERHPA